MPSQGQKVLVINADDYGMSLEVSRGILKAAEGGLLKSTTVMTTMPDFEPAMDELLKSGSNLDIGFHANLTWGLPVLDPREIKTLVNEDGKFPGTLPFLARCFLNKVSSSEVYSELRAQLERLSKKVGRISHMDGHHHVHAFPVVCDTAAKVAGEFGIPYIRSPHEGIWSPIRHAGLKRMVTSLIRASGAAYWRVRGFATSDYFGGFALGAGKGIEARWLETIARVKTGVTEIMVHPGFCSPGNDEYNIGREEEIKMLLNQNIAEAIKRAKIEVAAINVLKETKNEY